MPMRPPTSANGPSAAATAAPGAAAGTIWTHDDTERWLTDYPLPATFRWNGERAYPRYTLKKGYGFWLRVAGQYYPALRGLFAICHEILASLRPGIDPMPDGEQLAARVQSWTKAGELPLTAEDRIERTPGSAHPGENAPSFG